MRPHFPGLTGIVLAAGLSRRAVPNNKLLLPFHGSTVVRATVAAMADAGLDEVLVIVGHQRELVTHALTGLAVRPIFAEDFAKGMGRSLAAGIRHSSPRADAWVIAPGDLPGLSARVVQQIASEFRKTDSGWHVIPQCRGRRGHPVVVGGWLRHRLETLSGDEGARSLLGAPPEDGRCRFVEVSDEAVFRDVDDLSALARTRGPEWRGQGK